MNKPTASIRSLLAGQKILPLYYHGDSDVVKALTLSLFNAGIRMVEFTNRGPAAMEVFSNLVRLRDESMPDLLLAVGTIKSAEEARRFMEAGADVLISPVYDEAISAYASANHHLWIPGCMTPGEIHQAVSSGWKLIKLFPGQVLGTGFVEAIRPVFPEIDFVVTGGVESSVTDIQRWISSGALAVGLGSKLISHALLEKGQYDALETKTRELLQGL